MAWNADKPTRELSAKEKEMAQIAGIPADRPGLLAEYPKAVYREAENEADAPMLYSAPFKINGKLIQAREVADPEEEEEAIALGWYLTPDLEAEQKRRDELKEKDEEIARLKAQIEEQPKRGPGRPPKQAETSEQDALIQ